MIITEWNDFYIHRSKTKKITIIKYIQPRNVCYETTQPELWLST